MGKYLREEIKTDNTPSIYGLGYNKLPSPSIYDFDQAVCISLMIEQIGVVFDLCALMNRVVT